MAFHSVVRAIAKHMYPGTDASFEVFFERNLIPVAVSEGARLMKQGMANSVSIRL